MTQNLAINLGHAKAGLTTLAADCLAAGGAVLATAAAGYADKGNGSYVWPLDVPAGTVAIRVYDVAGTLLVVAVNSGSPSLAGTPGAVTLDELKEYLRLVDDGSQDNLLASLLVAAQESIADECDQLTAEPAGWPTLAKLAVKMLVAGWYTLPEGYTDKTVIESPAIRRIINRYKAWCPS